jgi:membrane associated rhomboid family serine protease
MFPYKDDNPTVITPFVTFGIIGANILIWVFIQGLGAEPGMSRSVCELALIPGELLDRVPPGTQIPLGPRTACVLGGSQTWFTPVTSMFLHGGWFHLIGNMWFLWVFGNNVEDSMGHIRFVVFYLLCGLAAAALQVATSPSSAIPMLGASGAIGGVMGAYIVLYPKVRVHMLIFLGFFVTTIAVPAYLMLGYWFLIQLLGGIPSLAREGGGVAFWAHVGGFVAGAAIIKLFRNPKLIAQHTHKIEPYRRW